MTAFFRGHAQHAAAYPGASMAISMIMVAMVTRLDDRDLDAALATHEQQASAISVHTSAPP